MRIKDQVKANISDFDKIIPKAHFVQFIFIVRLFITTIFEQKHHLSRHEDFLLVRIRPSWDSTNSREAESLDEPNDKKKILRSDTIEVKQLKKTVCAALKFDGMLRTAVVQDIFASE